MYVYAYVYMYVRKYKRIISNFIYLLTNILNNKKQ